jgi:hypothetical protein
MIEIAITQDIIEHAVARSIKMGSLKNSITRGVGNVSGFVGEVVVAQALGAKLIDSFDYDIEFGETRIEVKTKRTSVKPKPNYECSVAATNTKQQCDWYVFTRVLNDNSKAWILGYLPRDEYFRRARLMRKGEIDPSNNFTVKEDCYNVSIALLSDLEMWLA